MKKFLVLLLTLAMLLGCTTVFAAAQQPIMGSVFEYAVPHANMMTIWNGASTTHSIQNMDYVEYEVYFSHPELVKDIPFCFELTSSGTCDVEEDGIVTTWGNLADLKQGWNTIRIPLSSYGATGCDRTRFNYLRIFNNQAFSLPNGVLLEYYFRKVSFGTEAEGDLLVLPIGDGDAFSMNLVHPAALGDVSADEHTLPIFDCSVPLGEFTVDTTDYKAGGSSLCYILGNYTDAAGNPISANGQSMFTFTFDQVTGRSSIDASDMDTLEFWFYVSDVKALEAIIFGDTGLELTSAGRCDSEEICWRLPDILAQCRDGWNEIRLPFSTASGQGIDLTQMDFLRFFFVNAQNLPEKPITIKIDNIRLTDYEAQAAEQYRPEIEEMYADVVAKIADIPAWDEEDPAIIAQYEQNGAAWRTLYDEILSEYEALPSLAQTLGDEIGLKREINQLKRWVERYEKYAKGDASGEGEDDPSQGEEQGGDQDGEQPTVDQPAYNKTMIVIIATSAVACMIADVAVYALLRKKDKAKE